MAIVAGLPVLWWLNHPGRITPAQVAAALPDNFLPDPTVGKVLFRAGGCANCHAADPQAENPVLAGGAPLETGFGAFYPSNISPDLVAGIGRWDDASFLTAVTRGVSPRGAHYYPAFPYTAYQNVSWTDLLHLRAYLASLPASDLRSPDHRLRFPFNIRLGLGLWKALAAPKPFDFSAFADGSAQQRGAYLVEGLGHCGSCHTPRNLLMAEDSGRAFHGAPPLKGGEKPAPRLAGEKPDKILAGLDELGFAVRETSSMWPVTLSYSTYLPASDHAAIAAYLSSLSAD